MMKKEKDDIFKQKTQLVGGIVSRDLADKFSLRCLYLNEKRSPVIAGLIADLITEDERRGKGEKYMIIALGYRICSKLIQGKKPVAVILKLANEQLKRKKICPAHRKLIIEEAKKLYVKWKDDKLKEVIEKMKSKGKNGKNQKAEKPKDK